MERLFYSTGQVARQLGITLAAVRTLCENQVIIAETTPGGQWRVPASEVERLKREGLPPIPRPLPIESALPTNGTTAGLERRSELPVKPSAEVLSAEDEVAITRSRLETRRIEREIEENEDWFRGRQLQQAAEEAAERQRNEVQLAAERSRQWAEKWMQYALDSISYDARGEVEIEVHEEVDVALSKLQGCEPEAITRPIVDAAVRRALGPWRRKQEIANAVRSGMNKLPWEVRYRSEHASLKQRAWDAVIEAVGRLREEASSQEIETATALAVQPMTREYEHQQRCERIVSRVYAFDATSVEQEAAKDSVRKALTALPIGAGAKELERAEEAALVPYKAAIAQRKEQARRESERQDQRRAAERKVDLQLGHIERYLTKEYEFGGGYLALRCEAERLRPLIRKAIIENFLRNPRMTDEDIRKCIEAHIDNEG